MAINKAIINGLVQNGIPNSGISVMYADNTAIVDPQIWDFDVSPYTTTAAIVAGMEAAALAYATAHSYTLDEIIWSSPYPVVPTVVPRSQSAATRSLNSAFQVSTTRDSQVDYSVDVAATLSLVTGQSGTVVLEMATNSGFTTGVQTLSRYTNANSGSLTIGLNLTQIGTANLNGYVPAGNYVRLRTVNNTGTPTFTYQAGQETLL